MGTNDPQPPRTQRQPQPQPQPQEEDTFQFSSPRKRRDPWWDGDANLPREQQQPPPWLKDQQRRNTWRQGSANTSRNSNGKSNAKSSNPFENSSTDGSSLQPQPRSSGNNNNPFDSDSSVSLPPRPFSRTRPTQNSTTNPFDTSTDASTISRHGPTNPFDDDSTETQQPTLLGRPSPSSSNINNNNNNKNYKSKNRVMVISSHPYHPSPHKHTHTPTSPHKQDVDSLDEIMDTSVQTSVQTSVETSVETPYPSSVEPSLFRNPPQASVTEHSLDSSSAPSEAARQAAKSLQSSFSQPRRNRHRTSMDSRDTPSPSSSNQSSQRTARSMLQLQQRQPPPSPLAQQQLLRLEPSNSRESWQQFEREEETDDDESSQPETPQVTPTVTTNSKKEEEQVFSDTTINLTLHDLCDEARTTDDIAWRNALALLSTHPELADMSEPECLMKPLHVLVLALEPPPVWMTRALLYTHSDPTSQVDAGGRLPLHLLAATSAHVETMQLLVQEYPASIAHVDSRGFTPLQLLLKNDQVVLTLEHLRILLGQSLEKNTSDTNTTKKHLLHRRGEFLTATLEDLQALQATPEQHELLFEGYPEDVQLCLKRIVQWKRRQHNKQKTKDNTSSTAATEFANPACIPTVSGKLLPLHLLVKRQELLTQHNAPVIGRPIPATMSGLLRVLIVAYPEALVTRDGHGRTPLLQALLHKDALPEIDVVELLLGMRTPGYQGVPTWVEDLPMRQGERYSNPAMVPTLDSNQLALHIVAEECLDNYDLVSRVYDAYPGARLVQDARGRTPLHVALGNYRKIAVEERLLQLLFVDSIARCPDDDGKTPLDLVLQQQHRLEAPCHGSSKIYQDFFHASIDGRKNARQSRELLQRLRQLSPVLRRQASAVDFVQESLVEELASPISMFVILLNGCVLAALITSFRLELDEFARMQVSSTVLSNNPAISSIIIADWYSTAIFVLAGYHFASQVVYWIAATYMSELYHLCLSSFWRWVDVAAAILPILTAYMISADAAERDLIIQLGTTTTGLLWLSVLGYLVRWWHGMAVFMGGATKLVGLLIWPALSTGIFIVAFAQMFLTLPQMECIDGNATICSIHEAYSMVYELLLGQPIMDESLSSGMIALVSVFTALFLWLMISVLCIAVAEATNLDHDQIALECYWEPRLALNISLLFRESKPKIEEPPTCIERYCSALEIQWHVLITAIQGTNGSKEVHWYACCLKPRAIIPLRILAVLVIPLWLILGLITFGLLWPPQVRKWISSTRTPTKEREEENSTQKLSGVKDEILQLKRMSYEQTNDVQREIGELKQLLMRAMEECDSTSAS